MDRFTPADRVNGAALFEVVETAAEADVLAAWLREGVERGAKLDTLDTHKGTREAGGTRSHKVT